MQEATFWRRSLWEKAGGYPVMPQKYVLPNADGEIFDYWTQDPMPEQGFVVERCGSEVKNALNWLREPAIVTSVRRQPVHDENPLRVGLFRLSDEVHQWMYDRYSLRRLLERTGFVDLRVCRAHESGIPNSNNYLLDIEPDGSVRQPESLFMEGRKPV